MRTGKRFGVTVSGLVAVLFIFGLFLARPAQPPLQAATIKPQIVTDEKNNVVRVLIDGKEVLIIDAQGLPCPWGYRLLRLI